MAKGTFEIYPLLLDYVERVYAKETCPKFGIKIKKGQRAYKPAIQDLLKRNPDLIKTLDFIIVSEEYYWLTRTDRTVIFPATDDVLAKLASARVDIKTSAAIAMPHDNFILAMPKGFTFEGVPVPSLMITWFDSAQRDDVIAHSTKYFLGQALPRHTANPWESEKGLTIAYRCDDMGNSNLPESVHSFRFSCPQSWLPALAMTKDWREYRRIMHELMGGTRQNYHDSLDLTDDDSHRQRIILRLVIMLGVYLNAYPGALHAGFPGQEPKFLEPKMHGPWKKINLQSPAITTKQDDGPHQEHYRSWFFRQLNAPRYYQGEHAGKPPGSRVVFVRDTVVGREIEAETLE